VKKANRKTKQQRAVVYRGVDTRSEREVWYTDVWAVTVPLPYKGGKKAKLGRIREKHDSQDDANARKQEIDEFFFPTHEVGEITPVLPTRLGKERVTNCETVVLLLQGCVSDRRGFCRVVVNGSHEPPFSAK
jgi:hypothetical protein